jgi:hypothetical protein
LVPLAEALGISQHDVLQGIPAVEHPRWAVREAGEAAKVGATSSDIPGPREISGARCGAPMDSMQTRHVDLGKRHGMMQEMCPYAMNPMTSGCCQCTPSLRHALTQQRRR